MPGLDDVDLELDAIRAFHARRQAADAAVSGISEMQARAATVVHDYYRWLPPSVSLALASAGLGPDSDVTQRIAARLIGQGSSTDLAQVGEKVSPDELAASAANLDTSGLLAKAAYERYGVLYDTNARDGITATSGQGGGGWLQGAKHAFLEDWDDPMSKVRGATRAADMYGRFMPQFATGQYRNFRQQVADKGLMQTIRDDLTSPTTMFTNMARATLQTDIGAQTEQLTAGDRVESGSGFFMNDTKAAGMARRGNEMSFGPVETWGDGSKHAITIGRDIAGHLLGMEPGTRGYNLVSGLGDAAVQVAFMKPGMAASKERQAGQAFKGIVSVADDATALQRARASVGALWSPGRRMTYDATLAHSWVNGDGQKVAEAFSSIGSTHVLDQLTGGRLAPSTLAKLADAQTTEDVTKVLHEAVSAHELKSVVNASSWKRMRIDVRNGLPRFANRAMDVVPDSIIDLRDGRKALTEADRWASAMKLTEEQRGVLHDALSRVPEEPTFLGDGLDHFRAIEHEALVQKARASAVQQALRDASGNYMERYGRFKTIVDEGEAVHGAEKVYAAQRKLADARAKIDKVLRFGFDRGDEEVRYYQDELNQNHSFFGATLSDAGELEMPRHATPMLSSETVHGVLPMPNPEEVRRAFNSPLMQAWAKVPGVDLGTVALEAMMDKWRTVNLLKPALGVRIIGDGQARLLAEGGDSIIAHPIRAIAWMLGDSRFSDEWFAHGRANMLGELFNREDEWASSLNKTTRGFWQDIRYKGFEGHKGFSRSQEGFEDAWHYQLSKLHATAPGQIAAESENLDAAIGKWWDLADVREQYAKAHPPARSLPDALSGDDLLHPEGAAAFMGDVSKRLRHMTQDDPRLIEAVRTGKLRSTDPGIVARAREAGYPVTQVDGVDTAVLPLLEGITPNPLVTDALKADEFAGVAAGFGNREIVGRVAKVEEAARGKLDRVVDALFAGLLGRPENYLSKSPVARQEYWNFVREHVAYLDPAEADAIVANAEKAGLARDQLRTIKRMAGKAGAGDDLLTAEEMHHLAEAHAAQRVRDILDDMSHRHQAFDMVKLIMPFGEAWHQVVTKWGKILAQPHVWPEMSVAARALRSPELGSVVEPGNQSYDTSTGQMTTRGLFYPDENGNETVAFPLSRQMLGLFGDAKQALVGGAAPARVPIVGKVQGLSVGLDVMPGLGPVAQIPMAALMDRIDDPKYDGLRDILFPHGAPTGSTFQQVERGFVPSWLQKILKGNPTGFDDRAYASQVIDSMRYLASTGNYKVSGEGASQAEISRLIDDAKSQASTMALIRGLAQTTSPTAPAFDWEITDKDGKRVSALVLGRELHEMQSSSDPEVRDNAILSFLDKHGDGAFALLQGKSLSISPSGALPPTKEARAWLNANSFARGEYPLTYGLFAPNSPDAKFDGTTYFETLDAGDREQLDPEVALKLANRKVAQAAYYSIRGKMGSSLSAEQSVALYNFRKQLEQMYPGYSANGDDVPGAPTKASREQVLLELEKAAADPRFAKSELAEPLQAYMQLRKIAQDWSTTNYGRAETWATAKEGQAVRQVLFDTGRQIASEYPAFASAWETVLLPEFDNALVDQQGAN